MSVKGREGTTTMTWLSRISSSLLLCLAVELLSAASVTGRVELVDSTNRATRKSKDFSGVVVWLAPVETGRVPEVSDKRTATILQRDKRFTPHVLAIQVGTTVDFPNNDPIFHNAFSSFDGQIFDIGLYPPGKSRSVEFRRPGVVRVFCNIHPMMSAVIAVLPTPWFATTDKRGGFELPDVPPGEYRLEAFHERALPETLAAVARDVKVGQEGHDLGVIRISEAGYVPSPHKNKHGEEYPPQADDHLLYPGVKP
jgi:plastocyanin